MKVYAPGKLILSGEHAVVYGKPALAMAVNRYVTASVTQDKTAQIAFDLSDLAHHSRLNLNALRHLKERIKRKYHRFVRGDYSVRQVLQKPFELAQFALGIFAESFNLSLPHGVKIQVQSNIPIGCGMGSSAATILSVMHAVSTHLQIPLSSDALFQLALQAENMQHGHSSGLDLRVAMQGGCVYMQGDEIYTRQMPDFPLYLVNTGTPNTTTGQCVEQAAIHFKSSQIGNDFAAVTMAMDRALQQSSYSELHAAILQNHRLLVTIGVVPLRVQAFIAQLEQVGAAAKICGAGAVSGDQAGVLMVLAQDEQMINQLTHQYGYELISIACDTRGVHCEKERVLS